MKWNFVCFWFNALWITTYCKENTKILTWLEKKTVFVNKIMFLFSTRLAWTELVYNLILQDLNKLCTPGQPTQVFHWFNTILFSLTIIDKTWVTQICEYICIQNHKNCIRIRWFTFHGKYSHDSKTFSHLITIQKKKTPKTW